MPEAPPDTKETSGEAGVGALLRAALPSIPVVNLLPGIHKAGAAGFTGLAYTRPPVTIARGPVEAYAAVCGFPDKDEVPLTYPHLLAFGLHMAIMNDPGFPAPAIGTVHIANSITRHRPLLVGDAVTVHASVGAPISHPKGTAYDFLTVVTADGGDIAWQETSTYLRRGTGDPNATAAPELPVAEPNGVVWNLPGNLGRRYAAVSGDHNPIHLYPLTARALGFPRQIAHGMWTLARCVAALENRIPDHARVDCVFRQPVLLPGSVAFGSQPLDDGYAFSLTRPKDGRPHVLGRTSDL